MVGSGRRECTGTRGRTLRLVAALLAVCAGAGCVSWEESKSAYVDEINQLLHHRLPRAMVEAATHDDATPWLSLYVSSLRENPEFRAGKEEFLERFASVRRAHATIVEAIPESLGVTASAKLAVQVHGATAEERRISQFFQLDVRCVREDGEWRISQEVESETSLVDSSPVRFRDEAKRRGIWNTPDVIYVPDRAGKRRTYPAASGLAVGDIDADGHDDIFLVNGSDCRLFRNLGDGTFEEETEKRGCAARGEGSSRLALIADFDNDGRQDIFVGFLYGPNLLLRQLEDGTFEDVAEKSGLVPTIETMAACAADFNGDGHLDIYVVNGMNPYLEDPDPPYNALNGFPNYLFLNNGDGTFRDASKASGAAHTGYGLSCAAADYDLDGDIDLFVGNDFGFDVFFRNRGDGTFDDVTDEAGMSTRRSSMSSTWADVDGDGYPELYAGTMYSNSKWMVQQPGYPVPAPWPVSTLFSRYVLELIDEMLAGNLFYRNRGDGTFELAHPEMVNTGWAWSSLFFDCDNDARLDLYALNGFVSGDNPNDL